MLSHGFLVVFQWIPVLACGFPGFPMLSYAFPHDILNEQLTGFASSTVRWVRSGSAYGFALDSCACLWFPCNFAFSMIFHKVAMISHAFLWFSHGFLRF